MKKKPLAIVLVVITLVSLGFPVKTVRDQPEQRFLRINPSTIEREGIKALKPEQLSISLSTGKIKPIEAKLKEIRALYPGERARVIIQLNEPISPEKLKELSSLGVSIESYVPNFAFLADVQTKLLEDLLTLPFVRWVGPYKPEYKLSAAISKALKELDPSETMLLIVKGFSSDSSDELRADVEAAGGKIIRILPLNGAIVRIPAGSVGKLSEKESVVAIDLMKPKVLSIPRPQNPGNSIEEGLTPQVPPDFKNYFAGLITGTYWFRLNYGFDGTGITVAVGDTGLDIADTIGTDDDGDGLVDEDGPEPGVWVNNDGDYLINEDDPDDDGDGLVDEDPVNGIDDDGDWYVDEDPVSGLDEDGDGLMDEDEVDGVDNDGDGLIDEDPSGIDNDWG